MARRFSDKELFEIRNLIPIQHLIETILEIPSKVIEEVFRFLCPLCSELQTATNPKTNLARCFHCEKNFNTIDIVMLDQHLSFIDSIKFLMKYYSQIKRNNQSASDSISHDISSEHVVPEHDVCIAKATLLSQQNNNAPSIEAATISMHDEVIHLRDCQDDQSRLARYEYSLAENDMPPLVTIKEELSPQTTSISAQTNTDVNVYDRISCRIDQLEHKVEFLSRLLLDIAANKNIKLQL